MGQIQCKYCHNTAMIDAITRKPLCRRHSDIAFQTRELIKAMAMMHLEDEYPGA